MRHADPLCEHGNDRPANWMSDEDCPVCTPESKWKRLVRGVFRIQ